MRHYSAGPAFGAVHDLAEGPRWDDSHRSASWVDIVSGHVYRGKLGPDGIDAVDRIDFPDTVGAASPTADGGFVVAAHDRIVIVSPDGARQESIPLIDRAQRLRLNDAAVDPRGRLLVGSLATDGRSRDASVFSVDTSGSISVLREGMNLANGIGWAPDGATVYVADSVPGVVWSAAYDLDTGHAHGWAPVITEFDGLPDGLCVDSEGCLWVAIWNGAQVRCFAPSGEPLATVSVPAPQVTAVAFVGAARDQLLITTARDQLDEPTRATYPDSGRLFLAQVDAVGLACSLWRTRHESTGWVRTCGPGSGSSPKTDPATAHPGDSTPETG
jgi:sugar lactone lactonase YvrE